MTTSTVFDAKATGRRVIRMEAEALAEIERRIGDGFATAVDLIAASIPPVYAADGLINADGLLKLQTFFRERDFLQYEEDLDPSSFIDQQYMMAAMAEINPNQP